jgi:hypothetical protein
MGRTKQLPRPITIRALLWHKQTWGYVEGKEETFIVTASRNPLRLPDYQRIEVPMDQASGVTLKSRGPMLPLRSQSNVFPIGHFHLWQTLGIHDLVLLDDAVLVKEKSRQSIYLVGF